MDKFKISNKSDGVLTLIYFSSVALFFLIGIAIIKPMEEAGNLSNELAFIPVLLLFVGLAVGYLISQGFTTEVDYDGSVIRLKNFYGKKEIDLSKVKTVSYEFVKGYGRGAFDTICLTLQYFETSEDSGNEEKLHNVITGEETDKMIKGDFSDYPLLQMYEDIIARYPEKKSIEQKPE